MADFPRLKQLMGAWLNQDYDLHGDSVEAVVLEYARTSRAREVEAAVAELDVLLAGPAQGLLKRFEAEVSASDLIIGEDDGEARAWLRQTRAILAGALARGETAAAPPRQPQPRVAEWLARLGGKIAPPREG